MLSDLQDQFAAAARKYCAAHGIAPEPDWFVLKMQEEMGELTQVWNKLTGRDRRRERSAEALAQDLADETADLLGMVLLFARENDLDLAAAVQRKWRFAPGAQRPPA
ncbi:pyrophosphatase [Paroceanicella profunda]|uniref:Pyrophosphatase n=1 Tax=Paroceanicella profunda TaxID=2579971 RepID=A0A5B8FWA9_9RHOB|nr:pyrophosphatase [Paroceanicella profunda]QDL91764.1 pyrophosphatase [Paroceanicella profunda]